MLILNCETPPPLVAPSAQAYPPVFQYIPMQRTLSLIIVRGAERAHVKWKGVDRTVYFTRGAAFM
jgi:hypothetical protein